MLTEFGKMCRKMRIDRNELLAEMAGRVGVSPAFLSAVENGKRNVPDSLMNELRNAYGLGEDEFVALKVAAERSVRQIKIEMEKMNSEERDLVLAFARNFERIDEQKRKKLLELLK
ncbi:MAG: helix-turn-helix transcriptional regulator [Firmicutes bacterium]|nr:helix-turn-helix transcriptional regulator [Bacillota bacterium]